MSTNYPHADTETSSLRFTQLPDLFWFKLNVTFKNGSCRSSIPIKFSLESPKSSFSLSVGNCNAGVHSYEAVIRIQHSGQYLKLDTVKISNQQQVPAFKVDYDGKSSGLFYTQATHSSCQKAKSIFCSGLISSPKRPLISY